MRGLDHYRTDDCSSLVNPHSHKGSPAAQPSTAPNASRRAFLWGAGAAIIGLGKGATMAQGSQGGRQRTADRRQVGGVPRFFKDTAWEFAFLIALGKTYYMAGNPGKLLYLVGQIQEGDAESAFRAFTSAADEARSLADDSARRGHRVSARQAYLWAANYYYTATYFLDASADPSRFLPTWETYHACWESAIGLFDTPVEAIKIPYGQTALRGYFFRVDDSGRTRPLIILNNGSDGSMLDMWVMGIAAGLARGYHCLTFDGPGQGYALWKQQLYFRPDWEQVITPVVDYALTRPEVDPQRIALQGISQGGYWVPRAVAFERRIAAAIADPGVVDVSTSWMAHLPPPLMELLRAGKKAEFDQLMLQGTPAQMATLRFRMRPYGLASPYDTYKAVEAYHLRGVADKIRCPMLITDPEGEEFWPGQSQALYDMLTGPKTLVRFTAVEGADWHCEPKALGLRDLRIFDWLDETLRL
ncbi:MAG TPA: alpha/beta fold hydrolase [Alphaproteobacteria bacterium]|nr:alpha/beta fold hydrolase [Alphaproteobacteria bacterium]